MIAFGAALLDLVMQFKLVSRETWKTGLRMLLKVVAAIIWVGVFSILYRLRSIFYTSISRICHLSVCKPSAVCQEIKNLLVLEIDEVIFCKDVGTSG